MKIKKDDNVLVIAAKIKAKRVKFALCTQKNIKL